MAQDAIVAHDAYITFGGTVLSTRYRSFNPEETGETVESTAGDDDYVTREFTVIDAKVSCEFVMQGGTGGTTLWAALKPGNEGTLDWSPQGTASNAIRHYCTRAIVVKRTKPLNYRDVTVASVDFDVSADIVDTTW